MVCGLAIHFIKIEFLWKFGFHVFVIIVDNGHVGIEIASRVEDSVEAAGFLLEVFEAEHDRDVGALGNDVEAFLPLVDFLSGGFGTNGEKDIVVFAKHVNHLLDEVVLFAAVNGDAAEFAEGPTHEAVFEEFCFHHHFEMQVLRPKESPTYEEVFNGSVRCHDANALAYIFWNGVDGFPAANP